MITYNVENTQQLLIWEQLLEQDESETPLHKVPSIDVTLQNLTQLAWEFIKGKRDCRRYENNRGETVVKFRYEYTLETNTNIIADYDVVIEWFDIDGNVGLSKIIEKTLSRKYLTTFNKEVRQNQIDYLMGAGKGFREDAEQVPEPLKSQLISFADLVDALWVRYSEHIVTYVNTGSADLYTVVENEATSPFSEGLNQIDPSTGLTMRQTILNEIS